MGKIASVLMHYFIGIIITGISIVICGHCLRALQQFNGYTVFEIGLIGNIKMLSYFIGFGAGFFSSLACGLNTGLGILYGTWQSFLDDRNLWPSRLKYFIHRERF